MIADTGTKEDEGGGQPARTSDTPTSSNIVTRLFNRSPSKQPTQAHQDCNCNTASRNTIDIFVKHLDQQQQLNHHQERRASLPAEAIELATLSGVVMRRRQQFQIRQQQQQSATNQTKHLLSVSPKGRPLSISSISSAASSGSTSSTNSSSSSGIQLSLTRNGSLNYGLEYRKQAYLASVESLNHPQTSPRPCESHLIEAQLKNLTLSSPSSSFVRDAAARAAILAAGAQSRGFGSPGNRIPRINRSFHASLRYDKNMAHRIHTMVNARSSISGTLASGAANDDEQSLKGNPVSRKDSSTSAEIGLVQSNPNNVTKHLNSGSRFCQCGSARSITSSSSASQVDQAISSEKDTNTSSMLLNNKSATLDSTICQRSQIQHHPDCSYSKVRPRRASTKLQPSPSSASSHSNSSSLFRDDGFEDDLQSTASEHASSSGYHNHRCLSFQGQDNSRRNSRRFGDDDDEYQSCEEEFANSHTTSASTTSNLDDCALSTASSFIINQHEPKLLDKVSLANAKQQYRRSLLIEHQQQQYLYQSQHVTNQNRIQSLLLQPPKLCHLTTSANTSTTSSNISCSTSPTKSTKCDDRTVNIIGHMPTKSPGYWDSNLSIAQRVVTEIIETERTYVDDLEQIVTGYICYLRNVLKQQKRQSRKHLNNFNSNVIVNEHQRQNQPVGVSSVMVNRLSGEDEDKMIFDDDTTSVTNDVDDYDVDETDNDLAVKENTIGNIISSENNETRPPVDEHGTHGALITALHLKKLFSNLEDIYKFNKDLLFRLEECYLNPSSVAECFVENSSGFEVYTHYCTMYPQVVSTLTELMANQTSAQLLKERQNELNQSLPLGAYLLKPVQRILKYHILFQSLIKHTADDKTVNEKDRQLIGEAFSVMTSIACHINAMKKRHEHSIRVQEVQGLLTGWEGPDLTTLGELILEETFKLFNRPKSNRHLFLFDNVLLMTKKKRDGSLCYKGHIECSNLMLIENIEGQPLVFNTVPFDNPKALCSFQAKNLDKKRDWCLQMKEVMIKSFEDKIPVHVRDILMSLTNSSTSSNPSPKTSSSETARALRAPNYLERKRVKSDKKK